eukprot:scaffold652_cov260-Pinguiococcus_pyrenoidosus.AAC.7
MPTRVPLGNFGAVTSATACAATCSSSIAKSPPATELEAASAESTEATSSLLVVLSKRRDAKVAGLHCE